MRGERADRGGACSGNACLATLDRFQEIYMTGTGDFGSV